MTNVTSLVPLSYTFDPHRLKWDNLTKLGATVAIVASLASLVFMASSAPPLVITATILLAGASVAVHAISKLFIKHFAYNIPMGVRTHSEGMCKVNEERPTVEEDGLFVDAAYAAELANFKHMFFVGSLDEYHTDTLQAPGVTRTIWNFVQSLDLLRIITAMIATSGEEGFLFVARCFPECKINRQQFHLNRIELRSNSDEIHLTIRYGVVIFHGEIGRYYLIDLLKTIDTAELPTRSYSLREAAILSR